MVSKNRSFRVEWEGLDELVSLLDSSRRIFTKVINSTAMDVMEVIADDARSRAQSGLGTLPNAASTIQAVKDGKSAGIEMGGSKIVSSTGGTAGETMFGYDFGSNQGLHKTQFPKVIKDGTTVFPAWNAKRNEVEDLYMKSINKWWRGRGRIASFFGR